MLDFYTTFCYNGSYTMKKRYGLKHTFRLTEQQ